MARQPVGVALERNVSMREVVGLILAIGSDLQLFFFFDLVGKKFIDG